MCIQTKIHTLFTREHCVNMGENDTLFKDREPRTSGTENASKRPQIPRNIKEFDGKARQVMFLGI